MVHTNEKNNYSLGMNDASDNSCEVSLNNLLQEKYCNDWSQSALSN